MSKSTFERVAEWNYRCNKEPLLVGTEEYWDALELQLLRIQEELKETMKAVHDRDLVELLDGGCDLDVTVSGLNYLSGLEYQKAINRVLSNNDVKYTTEIAYAIEASNKYTADGEDCEVQSVQDNGEIYFSVHRTSDNKIMKLLNHPKVSLVDLAVEVS